MYDVIVIGGGIIGCATAMQVLQNNPELKLLLLEKETSLGLHQSGRNSGVIHSGLYYKPGSLKALNCRNGYKKLIEFCQKEEIPHEICGKIVVATKQEELPRLQDLYERGLANGLKNLRCLKAEEIQDYEPNCVGLAALHVPETGIVDYKMVILKYAEKIALLGGKILLGHRVTGFRNDQEVISENQSWKAKYVLNCGGLYSDHLACCTIPDLPLRILPFRGEYYQLKDSVKNLIRNLIYPVPDPQFPFLGVHFTRMMNGHVECGPNAVLAFGREAYSKTHINWRELNEIIRWPGFRKVAAKYWRMGLEEYWRSFNKSAFTRALQRLVPGLNMSDLIAAESGIRAQACDLQGNLLDDFDIRVNGHIVNVCNAPSPAATASLAISEFIISKI